MSLQIKDNDAVLKDIDRWVRRGDKIIQNVADVGRELAKIKRYKGDELLDVVGVGSLARIYQNETSGRLPEGDRDEKGRRLGYTLAQVSVAQEVFGTSPHRESTDEPVTLAFTNFKGGCWKTTSSWHFMSWAASKGYRVLAVDLDPQASLSRNLGVLPDFETGWETSLAPYMMLEEPLDTVASCIRKVDHANIDLIPGTLELQDVEWELAAHAIRNQVQGNVIDQAKTFLRVRDALAGVKHKYDIVVIDGTPTLGLIPLNIVFGADTVIVPTPTEFPDYCSTISFLKLLGSQFSTLNKTFGDRVVLPDFRFLATKYSPGKNTNTVASGTVLDEMIKPVFEEALFGNIITQHNAAVGKLATVSTTVFQAAVGEQDVKKDQWEKARTNFSSASEEIMREVVFPRWPSKQSKVSVEEAVA